MEGCGKWSPAKDRATVRDGNQARAESDTKTSPGLFSYSSPAPHQSKALEAASEAPECPRYRAEQAH